MVFFMYKVPPYIHSVYQLHGYIAGLIPISQPTGKKHRCVYPAMRISALNRWESPLKSGFQRLPNCRV